MSERMDHEKMRVASELPITGPAATDTLAASSGLELPGREIAAAPAEPPREEATKPDEPTNEPIPGEHDHTTEMPTQPGIVGTTGFGEDLPATETDPTLTEEGRQQNRWEGGGRLPRTARDVDESAK